MRLHSNLLFYGLDTGTWSDPPPGGNPWSSSPPPASSSGAGASWKPPTEDAANGQAHWDSPSQNERVLGTPSTAISSMNLSREPSTDEGSEAKGSESDSLPDSLEGYLVSQQQFSSTTPAMLPYMSTNAVPNLTRGLPDASSVFASYGLSPGSFLSTHGFAGNDVASHYGYDVSQALPSFPPTGPVTPSVTVDGVPVDPTVSPDGVPSLGSYAHLSGQCSRCCFHPKGRCANGYSCEFCHYDHDKRPRNGKKKRYRRPLDGTSDDGLPFHVAGLE